MFFGSFDGLLSPVLYVLVGRRVIQPFVLFVMRTAPVHFSRFTVTITFHKERIFRNSREKHAEMKMTENECFIKIDVIKTDAIISQYAVHSSRFYTG